MPPGLKTFSSTMDVNLKICPCACRDEKRPLIKKHQPFKEESHDGFKVFLFLLLVCALMIGGYLLYNQNRMTISTSLDLVHRDVWGADESLSRGDLLNKSLVANVVIFQTNGPGCDTFNDCIKLLSEMQMTASRTARLDIPYNFLIGGDGQTYEARGWSFEAGIAQIPRNTSLAVAFIGDYNLAPPAHKLMRQAQALIMEAINRGRLQRNYRVYGFRSLSEAYLDDRGALFVELTKRWKHWVGDISSLY